MTHRQKYMRYHKDYGCWLKVEGDCGRAMNPGEFINLRLGKELSVPCRLEIERTKLWYVEIGPYQVKMNLRKNEIYEIEN